MTEIKKKILFTIPNFYTAGSGKALLKIASRLDPHYFEPHIACLHNKGDFFQKVQATLPTHVYPFESPLRPFSKLFKGAYQTSRFFKTQGFDLIHSFHYSSDYSEPLGAKMAGIPWVFTKKNMGWGSRAWKLRSWLAKGIVVQNQDMFEQFYPQSDKTYLIPRGVDRQEFQAEGDATSLRQEFNLSGDAQVILTVANLVPVKGVETLIKAFNQIQPDTGNLFLFIVGDDQNEYGDYLKQLKSESHHADRILFTGKRKDINNFQHFADLFVLPTLNQGRQEGSPVALLEAMASGTPVLGSKIAGIKDQLAPFPEQLFEPGNADELAQKMENLLGATPGTKETIINKQLAEVEQYYTVEKETKAHEAFYKWVLGIKNGYQV